MIKNVHEILDEFNLAGTKEQRLNVLQQNNLYHFKEVLKYTFNPKYQFYVEDKFPTDYIQPDTLLGIRYSGIESEIRRAYLFIKGDQTADSLTEEKRKTLLLQLLESFEPKEAQVFFNMMQKDLKVKYLTANLVREVYPELLD
jgi:hypothetical protein